MADGNLSSRLNNMKKIKIVIVDGGFGNIYSISSAVEYLGYRASVTTNLNKIMDADRIILPGVGAFGRGMNNLEKRSLISALTESVLIKKIPFLGICLGMQLLAKSSEEAKGVDGLGWINGEVKELNSKGKLLPHIGFDEVEGFNMDQKRDFYFVHSYALHSVEEECKLFWSSYGTKFISGISKGNINGVQFHPEKSQSNGLLLLKKFMNTGVIY